MAPLTRLRCLGNPSRLSEHACVRGRFFHRALSDLCRNLGRLETLTSSEFPRHSHSVSSSAGHLVTAGHKQSPLTDTLALEGPLPPTGHFRHSLPLPQRRCGVGECIFSYKRLEFVPFPKELFAHTDGSFDGSSNIREVPCLGTLSVLLAHRPCSPPPPAVLSITVISK